MALKNLLWSTRVTSMGNPWEVMVPQPMIWYKAWCFCPKGRQGYDSLHTPEIPVGSGWGWTASKTTSLFCPVSPFPHFLTGFSVKKKNHLCKNPHFRFVSKEPCQRHCPRITLRVERKKIQQSSMSTNLSLKTLWNVKFKKSQSFLFSILSSHMLMFSWWGMVLLH